MRKIIAICACILVAACSSKKEGNMLVQGKVKGLKKGTLYLQKMKDTAVITVDSIAVLGDNSFKLTDNITSSEVYFLTFKGSNKQQSILFFGEKGTITIHDDIDTFGFKPNITGSKNQEVLEKFNSINKKFINEGLEFIKKDFDAQNSKDPNLINKVNEAYNRHLRRKVLFATNFAISNATSEVAPYIALKELYNANVKLLDTVNNSLSSKVKESIYGKRLNKYISKIKETK